MDELFKLDLKLNDINELAKEKSIEKIFSFIRTRPKILKATEVLTNVIFNEEKFTNLNKQLERNVNNFESYLRLVDKHRESLPLCPPPLSSPTEIIVKEAVKDKTPEKTTRPLEVMPVSRSIHRQQQGILNSPSSSRPEPQHIFKS
jgi:hypothetical protein